MPDIREDRRVAAHEAGHALLCVLFRVPLEGVGYREGGGGICATLSTHPAPRIAALVFASGRAAEEVLGIVAWSDSTYSVDRQQIEACLDAMTFRCSRDEARKGIWGDAKGFLWSHCRALQALANELHTRRWMTGDEVHEVLRLFGIGV